MRLDYFSPIAASCSLICHFKKKSQTERNFMIGFPKILVYCPLSDIQCRPAENNEHDKEMARTLLKADRRISPSESMPPAIHQHFKLLRSMCISQETMCE